MTFYAWIRECLLSEAGRIQLGSQLLQEIMRSVKKKKKKRVISADRALPEGRPSGAGDADSGNTEPHLLSLPEDAEK